MNDVREDLMKKIAVTLLTLTLLLVCMNSPALGISYRLENFDKARVYAEDTFDDISGGWYESRVIEAYEYGIINGIGNNKYDPNGNLIGAEAITIGARMHAKYKYGMDWEKN